MARAIWEGNINFGLINIPIELISMSNTKKKLDLNMIDERDHGRIQYKRVNSDTGKEVPWKHITKGYEYADEEYLALDKDTLSDMQLKSTQTIELEEFVDLSEIPYYHFKKPYVLIPNKKAQKSYTLLYKTLESKNKAALGKVTIKTREHLAAIIPQEKLLILNLLSFSSELKKVSEFEILKELKPVKFSKKEKELAADLVDSLTSPWKPEKFKDDYEIALKKYVNDLLKNPNKKPKTKKSKAGEQQTEDNVINISKLLEQSLKKNKKAK